MKRSRGGQARRAWIQRSGSPTEAQHTCHPPSSLTGRPIPASFWSSSGTWDLAFIYSAPYSDPMWCIQEWTQGVTDYSFSPYFR